MLADDDDKFIISSNDSHVRIYDVLADNISTVFHNDTAVNVRLVPLALG